jgi:RNA polymerase sigma-70 factor (ECF subfamily)
MLVEAVFAGEKAAYGQLYDRYAPLIRAVCYDVTGNLSDAQDLAQDVFVRAFEKLGRLRNPDRFGKWVVGIARLRCREWRRKNAREQKKHAELNESREMISYSANDGWAEELRRAVRTLPEKEQLALHTFYLQGKSADNARKIMGLSRSGFYRVLERARKRLEHLLTEEQEDIR